MKKAFAFLFVLAMPLVSLANPVPDLSGTWIMDSDIAGNASTVPLVFKQDGTKLSGAVKMPEGGDLAISGEIKEGKIHWKYDVDWEGTPLTMSYVGTLDASGKFEGTVEVQPMGVEGTFSAKRGELPKK